MKFKVGDRVMHGYKGTGTVRLIDNDVLNGLAAGVEYDYWNLGHDLNPWETLARIKSGHGYWERCKDLKLVKNYLNNMKEKFIPFVHCYLCDKDTRKTKGILEYDENGIVHVKCKELPHKSKKPKLIKPMASANKFDMVDKLDEIIKAVNKLTLEVSLNK